MGMPEVENEIYAYAKKYIETNSVYGPKVLPTAPTESKVFPLIVIAETDNPLEKENLDKTDQTYKIEYEIEVYATDTNEAIKEDIIPELKKLVNDVFDTHYGMDRRACNKKPNADRNVDRLYMRYTALIDENKKIYRR